MILWKDNKIDKSLPRQRKKRRPDKYNKKWKKKMIPRNVKEYKRIQKLENQEEMDKFLE